MQSGAFNRNRGGAASARRRPRQPIIAHK